MLHAIRNTHSHWYFISFNRIFFYGANQPTSVRMCLKSHPAHMATIGRWWMLPLPPSHCAPSQFVSVALFPREGFGGDGGVEGWRGGGMEGWTGVKPWGIDPKRKYIPDFSHFYRRTMFLSRPALYEFSYIFFMSLLFEFWRRCSCS